jgi:hypothetical protein
MAQDRVKEEVSENTVMRVGNFLLIWVFIFLRRIPLYGFS